MVEPYRFEVVINGLQIKDSLQGETLLKAIQISLEYGLMIKGLGPSDVVIEVRPLGVSSDVFCYREFLEKYFPEKLKKEREENETLEEWAERLVKEGIAKIKEEE